MARNFLDTHARTPMLEALECVQTLCFEASECLQIHVLRGLRVFTNTCASPYMLKARSHANERPESAKKVKRPVGGVVYKDMYKCLPHLGMTKSARCVNFPLFTMFSSSGHDLPVHGRFYDRFFSRQDKHTSGYDMLQDDHDAHHTTSAHARSMSSDEQSA